MMAISYFTSPTPPAENDSVVYLRNSLDSPPIFMHKKSSGVLDRQIHSYKI